VGALSDSVRAQREERRQSPAVAGTGGLQRGYGPVPNINPLQVTGSAIKGALQAVGLIPTNEEGAEMDALSGQFQTGLSEGNRRKMAEALGGQAGVLAPYMAGAGTFAGVGAKTANLVKLASAEAMEQAGKSADDIWRSTGWGRGTDGKWRFEIDDSASSSLVRMDGEQVADGSNFLGDIMSHDDLYKNYDDLSVVGASYRNGPKGGSYTRPENREYLGLFDIDEEIQARGKSAEDINQVLLHESQHAIQKRENFASGGDPREFVSEIVSEIDAIDYSIDDINQEMRKLANRPNSESSPTPKRYYELMDKRAELVRKRSSIYEGQEELGAVMGGAVRKYRNLAGEVESRNVEKRMNMNAADRLQTPPWATEDIPRDQQVVRRK
jgi:hypothetical protein